MNKFTPINRLSEIDKRISNAQAWNCAAEIMSGSGIRPVGSEVTHRDLKESLEAWHDWFYGKLTEPWNGFKHVPNVVKQSSVPWAKDYKKIYHRNQVPTHEEEAEDAEMDTIQDVPEGTPSPI